MKRHVLPVALATLWISVNEFVRNEVVLKSYWVDHYKALGFAFPADPINGALWGAWSLLMAVFFHFLRRRFSYSEAAALGWLAGYLAMWLVIGNLGVLPLAILPIAVPWSLAEAAGAAWLSRWPDNK
jgi:Na+-transporting NADH:ubiquinone oxidoreductase subunit NqrE